MLQACDLWVQYSGGPERAALRGVSVGFAPGRFAAIVGPNGSGKSTLLRVLSGILPPSRGTAMLEGCPLHAMGVRERARRVAVVPQGANVAFPFTVREVVLMGRHAFVKPLGSEGPEDFQAAEQAMEEAGVTEFADRPITELSGGEAQRVIAARALAQRTAVMLLDEPVSNLDIRHQTALLQLFARKARQGATVVCVLHDLNMAERFADDVLVMSQGQVVRFGPPQQALELELLEQVYGQKLLSVPGPYGRVLIPG